MAYSPIEQAYIDGLVSAQFPDPEPQPEPVQLADSGQVKSDAQAGFGTIGPIKRNKAQEALGYVGELLTKAGVELDKVGVDVPVLGRITLKDLTVGDSGKVLEDMADGFYPVEGGGNPISGTLRVKPDAAFELMNIAPTVGAAAKLGGKAAVKGVTKAVEATKGMPVGLSIKAVDGTEFAIEKAPKIETPAFKNWFGESKVADDSGKPIVVYHNAAQWEDVVKNNQYKTGKFFSSSPKVSAKFGPQTIPVYLKAENPYVVDAKGSFYASIDTPKEMRGWTNIDEVDTDLIAEYAHKHGYDSVIIKNVLEGNGAPEVADDYIVFEPTQIKSAIGNKGTFDPKDPRMLHGGAVGAGAAATKEENK